MKPQPGDNRKFRWQPNLKVLVFVLVFLPLTVSLGFWQLSRADEKAALLAEYRARETAAPVSLAALDADGDHQYRRVTARGRFDNRRTVLLENRVRLGRPGFEVVTLFELEDNARPVWVNRGWIAGHLDRTRLPEIPEVAGPVTLFGHLYRPLAPPFTVGKERWRSRWPQVMQNLDTGALSARMALTTPPHPYRLRLDRGSPGALETGWDVVNVLPEKHLGYAVQWFAMAFALAVLALFANSNLGEALFGKRSGDDVND